MKKPIALLTTFMLLASPAYADWDEISNKMSELGDAVSDTAQDAWTIPKRFQNKRGKISRTGPRKRSIPQANGQKQHREEQRMDRCCRQKKLMS